MAREIRQSMNITKKIDWLRPALTMEQEHQTIQFMNMIYKIKIIQEKLCRQLTRQ